MILLTIEHVSKAYAPQTILSDVTFGIHTGDRIGMIGANGSGKSTLLNIIAGVELADEGQVIARRGTRIAYLEQRPRTAKSATLGQPAEQGRGTLALLDRLGLSDLETSLDQLSGGEQRRAALAEALSRPADLLLLDEPTNHLDIDVIDWLEDQLIARPGALLIVTHDRYLLDRVCNRILEVSEGAIFTHGGSYEAFLDARRLRDEQAAAAQRKRRSVAARELAWLRRNPKARTGKSKFRTTRAEELQIAGESPEAFDVQFELPTRRLGSKIVNLDNAGKSFGGKRILRGITMKLDEKSRIGLVGPNGSGKTTLLRLIAGSIAPDTGKVSSGTTVTVGWYGQEPVELPHDQQLLSAVEDVAVHTKLNSGISVSASQLLERFGFSTRQHGTRVGDLSGGERRRLELLLVLATGPNVLLLDEPTNDLDLDTLRALEEFLDTWPGSLVVASHDRYFLDRIGADIHSLDNGALRNHPGGWAAYRADAADAQPSPPSGRPAVKAHSREERLSFHEQRELERLSERIPHLESRRDEVEKELAEVADDWQASAAAGRELEAVLAELARAEHRWIELSTRHD